MHIICPTDKFRHNILPFLIVNKQKSDIEQHDISWISLFNKLENGVICARTQWMDLRVSGCLDLHAHNTLDVQKPEYLFYVYPWMPKAWFYEMCNP